MMKKRHWPLWGWGLAIGGFPPMILWLWFVLAGEGVSWGVICLGLGLVVVFAVGGAWWGWHWGEHLADRRFALRHGGDGEVPDLPPSAVKEWEDFRRSWNEVRERTQQMVLSQKDFTANAAHELRTPLAALRLTGEGLFQGNPDLAEVRETVGAMLEEADRVSRLVDQLLMLARAESGGIGVEADYHPLKEIVHEVVEIRQVLAEDQGQTLRVSEDGEWSVWADRNLLRLALDNLLANALRHSPEGSFIEIQIQSREKGGVAISIKDEGRGLREGESTTVFERFYRGAGAVPGSGFGLGLPLARWGVEAFGGNLQAPNRGAGKGPVVTILCPETEWDHFVETRDESAGNGWQNPEESWVTEAAPGQVLARMESSPRGLSEEAVKSRREIVGANRFQGLLRHPFGHLLRRACQTPFNGILLVCMALSMGLGETQPAIVMGLMVVLSTSLRFWQEKRSYDAARGLEKEVAVRVSVARPTSPGGTEEVAVEDLVPGDMVHLAPGDMVPADLRLISAQGLEISETTLTGESFPVAKTARSQIPGQEEGDPEETPNLCYMGTHVVRGGGIGVVLTTGRRTRLGRSTQLLRQPAPETAFQRGVRKVSWLLLTFMAALVPAVLLLNGWFLGNWTEALLFALAVAVGLTPELLPVMVNVNLARAARALAKKGLIIKNLSAVHSFGSMDILCLDKTGTLTEDRPAFRAALDGRGHSSSLVLQEGALNAHCEGSVQGPLDREILRQAGTLPEGVKRGEIPFDYDRKIVSILWQKARGKGPCRLICKGAAEAVLERCTRWRIGEEEKVLSPGDREVCEKGLAQQLELGRRVLAVAVRELPGDVKAWGKEEETGMTFLGFLVFEDPVREGVREVVQRIQENGVRPILLTGDHAAPAQAAAREAGFPEGKVYEGRELAAMSEPEAREALREATVVARLGPADKAKMVRLLRKNGHRVGFLGDGANDANALREADVGIVAEGGADLSRASAEVIMTSGGLTVLAEGMEEGRIAFGNILKYIKITASSNFGNAFSVLLASLVLPFLPMRAVQLLVQNLLYDILQFFLPWDRVDADFRSKPRPWSADSIGRFMLVFGPLSSIFDLATFAFLWFVLEANTVADQAVFQTGWFLVGIMTQIFIFFVLRTGGLPFLVERASPPLALAGVVVAGAGLVLPWTPLGEWLGFVAMPPMYLLWVGFILISYGISAQIAKVLYRRKLGSWW
ncbi:MAG: magnesium-translocating P-type ATPase [Opitutales bacterium]|nr:magnesium-translocating P-type ATPase [Opitutales bacterium]